VQAYSDYAVQILLHLHAYQGEQQSSTTIAEAVGMTYRTFTRLAFLMKHRGLLVSVQGRGGGYMLGRPADEISFYDVFTAVEGEPWINQYLRESRQRTNSEKTRSKVGVFLHTIQDRVITEMGNISIIEFE